jgi:hypothetical protein
MLPLFEWLEALYNTVILSPLGTALNLSVWLYAILQSIHLLTLAMIGCAVLAVDLRLLGWGLRGQPVSRVAAETRPWLLWGLAGQVATGLPLFVSLAASKYYVHPAFWWKMYFLAAALLFTFTIRQRVIAGGPGPWAGRLAGLCSIALWSGVGLMAKGIAYY